MSWSDFMTVVMGTLLFLGILALVIMPFVIGGYLARKLRMPDHGWKIGVILWTLAAGLVIVIFGWPPKLGIDLSGGVILVYELQESEQDQAAQARAEKGEDRGGLPWYVNMLIIVGSFLVPLVLGSYLVSKLTAPGSGWRIGMIVLALAIGVGSTVLVYEFGRGRGPEGDQAQQAAAATSGDVDDKLIAAVSRRVNPGGVKEVTIRPYGEKQIEIIIPINPQVDPDEAKRIESLISRAGTLEFRILANTRDDRHKLLIERAKGSGPVPRGEEVILDASGKKELGRWVPVLEGKKPEDEERVEGLLSYPEIVKPRTVKRRGRDVPAILVVEDSYDVTGDYLDRAVPDVDQRTGNPCVTFVFKAEGGRRFGGLTGENRPDETKGLDWKLGIILDRYLYSAPVIQTTIFERGEITGSFTDEEVKDLVGVLNAGSLPTVLSEEPISRLETGPTLGRDTIRRGGWAIGASMVLVLLFMLFYYRFAGVVACMALLMNLVLILAIMIIIKAAFTLPGLAGLVLTVGMAVDANVLVFERIREELARGAALRMAIRNGFARATTTIVDANLTTLITGLVLYWIGTDQVRGFAVTLILGVTLSMFTAIFCSRVVFDIAEKRRWLTRLKMVQMLGKTQIDFLGKRRLAASVSMLVILVGLVCVWFRGVGLLDIDFTGGVSVGILFDKPQDVARVREALAESQEIEIDGVPKAIEGLPDLAVSDVKIANEKEGLRFVIITSQDDIRDKTDPKKVKKLAIDVVEEFVQKAFPGMLASMEVRDLAAIAAAEEKPPAAPKKKAAAANRRRNDLPPDSVLAQADPASLRLAQVDSSQAAPSAGEEAAEEPSPEQSPDETAAKPAAGGEPFSGGTQATLTFAQGVDHDTLEQKFNKALSSRDPIPRFELSNPGYDGGEDEPYGTWNVKIELPPDEAREEFQKIEAGLEPVPYFPSSNTIGGKVAGHTRTLAITALLTSLLCIVGYIWIRFQRVVFGLAAVVALVHDVLVTLGVIALSAYVAGFLGFLLIDEFKIGLPVLAAFLTIIGYSLNDTIVVFDRIREVRGKAPRLTDEMVNASINQTLARTLLTSLTTLIVVLILYVAGGQQIHAFAFSLVVGVMVGTYSSIFVASPALLWMSRPSETKKAS